MHLRLTGRGTSKCKDQYVSNTPPARESESVRYFKNIFLQYHGGDELINPKLLSIINIQTINDVI